MKPAPQIALIAVTQKGVERARHLRQRLKTGEVYRPARYGSATAAWDRPYDTALASHVAGWFAHYDHLVFFLATGAVTRLIAPYLDSKTTDPGILAVDEAGRFVIPMLSGHQGGANAFARTVAGHLGATPVITTASDVIGGLSLDVLGETLGWVAEPAERLKAAAMALVNQEPVAIIQEVGSPGSWLNAWELPSHVTWVPRVNDLPSQSFSAVLWITDRLGEGVHRVDARRIPSVRPPGVVLGGGGGG